MSGADGFKRWRIQVEFDGGMRGVLVGKTFSLCEGAVGTGSESRSEEMGGIGRMGAEMGRIGWS